MATTAASAAELKQQGAFEAAADPNSSVTAADAKALAKLESQKAGVGAYSFNPNASPEEKAAQARAHVPSDFHHEHKPKGVAIATDRDDGVPGAYDLPEPTTAGALPASTAAKDENGNPVHNGTAGNWAKDDAENWTERVGWAPRFGQGPAVEAEEGTSADHQTWLEGKLDEKFFGDWYHNAGVIAFACLASWFVAVVGGGLAWLFVIMAICGTYYRTSIRRVRRNFRDDVDRELAKTKLETDSETLGWMNNFLVKFWPIFAPVLAETVVATVDQVLSTSTPAFLDSMRMSFFTLGSKPPRMEHVKSYPNSEDDTVIMDWKFSFTPNDTADMTKNQMKNKINPKLILEVRIGKAMVSKALEVIVEDFAFSGLLRVKIKLQIPYPHVDRVDISFLERPTIDYVCKPLGGETFGFDINFVPGLESFIMEQIHANLGPIMYAPNVFPIEVAKMLAGSAVDQAIGVVAVTLHGAQGLKNADKFAGTPDPYAVVSLNSKEPLDQTKVIKENANPKWNETKYIIITSLKDMLTLQVYDYNEFRKDKELGTASFSLEKLDESPQYENEQLEVMSNGKARGLVLTDLRFFPVLGGGKLADGTEEPVPESNTGIAHFHVEQAKDLDGSKSFVGALNPYCVLLLNGKEIQTSRKLKRTNNPIWDNANKEILITDRKTAKLGVVIKDDRGLSTDPIVGTYQVRLDDMMCLMEKGQEWYNLAGAQTGRVKMTLQWKPVALAGPGAGTGGYVTPIGVMRIHFKSARALRNVETMGKSDPYARVLLSGIPKGRTVTFQNNLDPDWDEVFYVPMHNTREKLTLEVMDQENLQRDRTLGQVEILAADYIKQDDNGEFLSDSRKIEQAGQLRMHGKGTPKGVLNFTVSFYPCLNLADPEDDAEEAKVIESAASTTATAKPKSSAEVGRLSSLSGRAETKDGSASINGDKNVEGMVNGATQKQLAEGEKTQVETTTPREAPKLRLTPEQLVKYESGLIIFRLLDAHLMHSNCHVEIMVDDHVFPSYVSATAKTRQTTFDETGDCFVRELDFSKLTLRLREKSDNRGDEKKDRTIAKLTGNTIETLMQCMNNPTVLTMKDEQGQKSDIRVSLRYLPVKMTIDPSESINNMGTLRVDVLDGTDLPSADRNGFSDPFCKFELNKKEVFKTQVQKKTLHPAWNEYFETDINSRTTANLVCKVWDWDFASDPDFLGQTAVNLELLEPFKPQEMKLTLDGKSGSVRLRLLFRPSYVQRSRQGSSTFHGTFAMPGRVVTGVAGVPVKGVGMAAHGVGRGASFIRHGFKTKSKEGKEIIEPEDEEMNNEAMSGPNGPGGLRRATDLEEKSLPVTPPNGSGGPIAATSPQHSRTKSSAGSVYTSPGTAAPGPAGIAYFTVVSASGFPPKESVMVYVRQLPSKKTIHKTKHIKSSSGLVKFDETFSTKCAADTQFQVQVKAHATFGSDDDLGEGLLVVDESGSNQEKTINAGAGTVVVKSNFVTASTENGEGGAAGLGAGGSLRKNFLTKRENGRASRDVTPNVGS